MPIDANAAPISEDRISNPVAITAVPIDANQTKMCADCGATVIRAFCPECGQRSEIHHSLFHLVEELLHGLFHFDTKAWRTIPALVFHPGDLTNQYIAGQRTRFLSPLGLFLFLIVLMFVVFGFTSDDFQTKSVVDRIHLDLKANIQRKAARLVRDENRLAALPALASDSPERVALVDKIAATKSDIAHLQEILQREEVQELKAPTPYNDNSTESVRRNIESNVPFLAQPFIIKSVSEALQHPDLVLYRFKNTLSKLAFLLIPISLPFLWLMFARRRQHSMFQHAVFSLYSLSFMSILLMVCAILGAVHWYGILTLLLLLIPPIHMFRHLRETYQLSLLGALWRTVVLLLVALFSLSIFALIALQFSL